LFARLAPRGSALPRRVRQGRGELREQPSMVWWSGDGSNSPFGPVATRSVVVAERAVPRAPDGSGLAPKSRPRGASRANK
jgi:hypothetical protein